MKLAGHKGRQAFTLLEVMIALGIMAMALASASICLRMGMMQYDTARSTNYATQILQNEAERIRLLSWSEIENLPSAARFSPIDRSNNKYQFKRILENYNGSDDIKRIWLIANWKGLKGEPHQLKITFNYARDGAFDYLYGSNS
ncbi:type IV pilus modification PilV family protein [Puniceicoccus vermicola]|uniref:Prepilin-type N-terminal cleavage/methylation domain-containing protein n=1 Tax=Puniceicoccus vermicola TaxID=388746 RepID=A0A7X1E472_9BACT|nr:prepilin-type N-terminal cleavage/methylation domain-containing protein [Puniceicoccus vermicola]MBC2602270.1 prepilin-type N-terminal cleavage/methylation domain-containing protein [Puniceicoccus vermicola]